jgi:competence protein ComEC
VRPFVRLLVLIALAACRGRGGAGGATGRDLVLSRVMINPTALPDERGEWIEITNAGAAAADLHGWQLRSANDAGFVVRPSVIVAPGGAVILARAAGALGGTRPALVYSGIALANGADWLALRDPEGVTRDSVAWTSPPRGVALEHRRELEGSAGATTARDNARATVAPPATDRELVVHVLDVGQGDAILIQNGGSTVLVDGGPDRRTLARWLDLLHVRDTIDAVILTHMHGDHFEGLRELFATRRRLAIRTFWSNGDAAPNLTFSHLPDSIDARRRAGSMEYRDTDDPCSDGRRAVCTLPLRGGAKVHIMRPLADALDENNRSAAVKLVGPDSASFTMWMAGDAEHDEMEWFMGRAGYAGSPGMHADVLKANHHGSCDGVSERYLALVHPSLVVVSLAAQNDYGHMHTQAKAAFARQGIPWYRTDQNGTITIRSPGTPGGGFTVSVERGTSNAIGPSDRRSFQPDCVGM